MLIFELLLLLFTLLCLFTSYLKANKLAYIFLVLALLSLISHALMEGLRWQLILTYLLIVYALLQVFRKVSIGKIGLGFSVISLTISVVLACMLPALMHNKNTGNYAVGTYSFEVFDTHRQRTLPTKVWFPIEATQDLVEDYWLQSYAQTGPVIAKLAGMPGFIFSHLENSKPTYLSTPTQAITNDKPLILLSHGRGAIKEFNAFMAQEFASHGYVVIASDHTKGALLSVLNDGSSISFDPKEFGENEGLSSDAKQDRVQQVGLRWSQDLTVVLKDFQDRYPNYTNRKVIVGGHSTGGGSTIQYCGSEQHCLGVIGLDPWFEPVSDEILVSGINKPLLSFFSDPYEEDFEPINHLRYEKIANAMTEKNIFAREVVISKSGHVDYCDAALLSPYSYLFGQDKGKINTHTVMKIINQHALDFSNALTQGKDLYSIEWQKFPQEMAWVNVE